MANVAISCLAVAADFPWRTGLRRRPTSLKRGRPDIEARSERGGEEEAEEERASEGEGERKGESRNLTCVDQIT